MQNDAPKIVSITTGTILRTVAVLIGIGLLWLIRDILLYVFTAILIAGVVYPIAKWAETRKVPKGLAVLLFYVLFFSVLAFAFARLVPAVLSELGQLVSTQGPQAEVMRGIVDWLKGMTEQYGLQENLSDSVSTLQEYAQRVFGGLLSALSSVFGGIAALVVVLVLSFYMIVEESAARTLFLNVIPTRYQEFASRLVWLVIDRLGGWLRGQMLLGLIIGFLYFLGYWAIGVPYALLLALLGGLLEFIPYVGPFIAAVPAIFFAFTDSPMRALAAFILILVIQQLENNVIVPWVMRRAVGLNPIVSIVAFMVGAKLFGVVGAIFAIPVATAASVVIIESLKFHRGES
jgi:predicted PurR-regulated permease PerM